MVKEGVLMNEELSSALAELAKGFGVSTGELWSWLQSDGVAEYAKVQVAQLKVNTFGSALGTVVCIVMCIVMFRGVSKGGVYNAEVPFIGLTVFAVGAIFFAATVFANASELAGWMASPQGMVISMLLERVG